MSEGNGQLLVRACTFAVRQHSGDPSRAPAGTHRRACSGTTHAT